MSSTRQLYKSTVSRLDSLEVPFRECRNQTLQVGGFNPVYVVVGRNLSKHKRDLLAHSPIPVLWVRNQKDVERVSMVVSFAQTDRTYDPIFSPVAMWRR